jgi:hypothetical protein
MMDNPTTLIDRLLAADYSFQERPRPVPGHLRSSWRVSLLLLAVDSCWGRQATWHQAQVVGWALRSRQAMSDFVQLREGAAEPDDIIVRYDPSLDRAIDLAVGFRLLRWNGMRLGLTSNGINALDIIRAAGLLHSEAEQLVSHGKITNTLVDQLLAKSRL